MKSSMRLSPNRLLVRTNQNAKMLPYDILNSDQSETDQSCFLCP